jgi:hypothetical protein
LNTSLTRCSLLQVVVEEGVGAVEVEAAGANRVVARTVILLRVLVLASVVTMEVGGTPLPTMASQIGLVLRGEANTVVVDEVEGTTDTHLHGKTRVKVACASSTALRVVATRVTIAPFCTSRLGVRRRLLYKHASCQHIALRPNLCMSYGRDCVSFT